MQEANIKEQIVEVVQTFSTTHHIKHLTSSSETQETKFKQNHLRQQILSQILAICQESLIV